MSRQPFQPINIHNQSHTYYPILASNTNPNPKPNPNSKPSPKPSKISEPAFSHCADKTRSEIDKLRRQNMEIRQREEVYIQKLMKLQAGLEYQNTEFVKMQQLYTELFDCYKQKEAEIIELELRYRQTDRNIENRLDHRQSQTEPQDLFLSNCRPNDFSFKDMSLQEEQSEAREKQWVLKEAAWKEREKQFIQQIEVLKAKIESNNQMLESIQELRSKEKATCAKLHSEKLIQNLNELSEKFEKEQQIRLKFQYQNEFLRARNTDLEERRQELERLITHKQQEIGRLREEKIKLHRQGSQKMLQRSRRSPTSTSLSKKSSQMELMANSGVSSSSESGFNQYFSFSGEGSSAQSSSVDGQSQ